MAAVLQAVGRAVRSAASAALIMLVRSYQAMLSPLLGRQCRFVPTCSNYFLAAVERYGPWRGAAKGLWRVLRCHPFGGAGHDPP